MVAFHPVLLACSSMFPALELRILISLRYFLPTVAHEVFLIRHLDQWKSEPCWSWGFSRQSQECVQRHWGSVTDPGGGCIITDTVFKEEEAKTKGSLKQTLFINWKDNRRRDQFTCLDNATFRMDVKEHWQDGQIVHVRGASFYRGVCRTCPNNHKVEHRHDVSPHLPQPAYNYCHFTMPS